MSARAVTYQGQIHDPERQPIAEMVCPTNQVRSKRETGLFQRLSEDHGSESREDFEQIQWRHHGFDSPSPGVNEGQPKDIISKRRDESRRCANHHAAPKLSTSPKAVGGSPCKKNHR